MRRRFHRAFRGAGGGCVRRAAGSPPSSTPRRARDRPAPAAPDARATPPADARECGWVRTDSSPAASTCLRSDATRCPGRTADRSGAAHRTSGTGAATHRARSQGGVGTPSSEATRGLLQRPGLERRAARALDGRTFARAFVGRRTARSDPGCGRERLTPGSGIHGTRRHPSIAVKSAGPRSCLLRSPVACDAGCRRRC